jgi:hypothetical protein
MTLYSALYVQETSGVLLWFRLVTDKPNHRTFQVGKAFIVRSRYSENC